MTATIGTDSVVTFAATSNGLLDCTGVVALGVDAFLLEGGIRFSFRFDVSVDRAGVLDALCNGVAVVDDDDGVAVDRLGVLNAFGNGGLSFFCLLTSVSTEMSAIQLAVIPVLAMLAGLGLRAELTERR